MSRKRRIMGLGLAIVIGFGGLVSCDVFSSANAPELIEDQEMSFITEVATIQDIEDKFHVEGTVFSDEIHKLAFEKEGVLAYYNVYIGKRVKEGEVLAYLDITELEHSIEIGLLRLEQEQLRLNLAKKSGNPDAIRSAEIALEIQEIELDRLYSYRDHSKITSPVDGVISSFSKRELGSIISPNFSLISIMDTKVIAVKFKLNEKKIETLKVGDLVTLTHNGEDYESEVISIYENVVCSTVPVAIRDQLNITHKVGISKITQEVKDAVVVPKVGIYTDLEGNSKVQILRDNKIIIKSVILGIELDEHFQVLEGVEVGDVIVVK